MSEDVETVKQAKEAMAQTSKGYGGSELAKAMAAAGIPNGNGKGKSKNVTFKIPPLPLQVREEESNIVKELEKANKAVNK